MANRDPAASNLVGRNVQGLPVRRRHEVVVVGVGELRTAGVGSKRNATLSRRRKASFAGSKWRGGLPARGACVRALNVRRPRGRGRRRAPTGTGAALARRGDGTSEWLMRGGQESGAQSYWQGASRRRATAGPTAATRDGPSHGLLQGRLPPAGHSWAGPTGPSPVIWPDCGCRGGEGVPVGPPPAFTPGLLTPAQDTAGSRPRPRHARTVDRGRGLAAQAANRTLECVGVLRGGRGEGSCVSARARACWFVLARARARARAWRVCVWRACGAARRRRLAVSAFHGVRSHTHTRLLPSRTVAGASNFKARQSP